MRDGALFWTRNPYEGWHYVGSVFPRVTMSNLSKSSRSNYNYYSFTRGRTWRASKRTIILGHVFAQSYNTSITVNQRNLH